MLLSPHRITPNSQKRGQKILNTNLHDKSNREHGLKRSQITSNDLK